MCVTLTATLSNFVTGATAGKGKMIMGTSKRDLEALKPIVDIINRNLTPSHCVLKAEAIDEPHGHHGIWLTTNIRGLVIFWGQNADTWGAGIDKNDGNGWEEQIDSACPFTASARLSITRIRWITRVQRGAVTHMLHCESPDARFARLGSQFCIQDCKCVLRPRRVLLLGSNVLHPIRNTALQRF